MRPHRLLRSSLSLLALLVLLLSSLPPARLPSTASAAANPSPLAAAPSVTTGLYRATVAIANPAARDRLKTLGVVVLSETPSSALVLADAGELEDLARLRFEPQTADDLAPLVAAALPGRPGSPRTSSRSWPRPRPSRRSAASAPRTSPTSPRPCARRSNPSPSSRRPASPPSPRSTATATA